MWILWEKILLYWPPKWPPCHVVANQELFKSINRLLLNVIDYGTRSFLSYFEKNCSYVSGISVCIFGLRLLRSQKNEKLQCRTNQDSDVTYCKRCSYSSFCIGGETMDEIICEEQWLVLTKELIKCTADVERTKPNRINLQWGIPTLKRQSKQLI